MSNIIKITITGGSNRTETAPVWLHSYGMILEVDGLDLPSTFCVDFSNNKKTEAIRVIALSKQIQIPDEVFLKGDKIYCWIYLESSNSGYTCHEIIIPLLQRPSIVNSQNNSNTNNQSNQGSILNPSSPFQIKIIRDTTENTDMTISEVNDSFVSFLEVFIEENSVKMIYNQDNNIFNTMYFGSAVGASIEEVYIGGLTLQDNQLSLTSFITNTSGEVTSLLDQVTKWTLTIIKYRS